MAAIIYLSADDPEAALAELSDSGYLSPLFLFDSQRLVWSVE